jgi:putative hydrolase of the HAD superfamily
VRLAVISNWDERLEPLLKKLGLHSYFEAIVISCDVGFTKPSPVIYGHALRRLGLPPEAVLHVGDSAREDVEGARAAGMRAQLVNRSISRAASDGLPGDLISLIAKAD